LGGALIGGAIGAVAGGIKGGLNAQKDGLSFWKGIGSKTTAITLPMPITATNSQYGNNAEMRTDYDTNIGSVDGMTLEDIEDKLDTNVFLGTDNNLPAGYSMDSSGSMYNAKGNEVGGFCNNMKSSTFGTLHSQITIAPGLKGLDLTLRNMVFKHEFMHAWHWKSGFSNFDLYTERATSTYSLAYSKAYNYPNYAASARLEIGSYPREYSWRNFNKIVPLWIK
jgi:hypothetical protein